ncbi:MAG TPA: hypothetical protein VHW01_29945 [Polyangiaceae bacterium]|nr:hypothetical protein [Polyangiaceae bacterium]
MSKTNQPSRLTLLVLAGVAGLATRAQAAPPPQLVVALSYRLDPGLRGCEGEAEFRESVVAQLGYDPFRSEAPHHITAEVTETESGIDGRLAWADSNGNPEGERRLSSPGQDCDSFLKNMAFAMAVQIQLISGTEAESVSTTTPASAPPTPPPKPAPAERSFAQPAAPARTWSLVLGAGPVAEVGPLPSLAEGFRLFAAVRADALSLELSPQITLPVTQGRADSSGFHATSYAVAVVPCARRSNFALCAVGVVGLLSVRGFGVDDARSPSSFVAKAGLRLAVDQPLSRRLTLGAHADGLGMLTPRTVLLNEEPVWRTPALGLALGIDVGLILP